MPESYRHDNWCGGKTSRELSPNLHQLVRLFGAKKKMFETWCLRCQSMFFFFEIPYWFVEFSQADVFLALATHQMCPVTLLEDLRSCPIWLSSNWDRDLQCYVILSKSGKSRWTWELISGSLPGKWSSEASFNWNVIVHSLQTTIQWQLQLLKICGDPNTQFQGAMTWCSDAKSSYGWLPIF